jgi:hypothetical protein
MNKAIILSLAALSLGLSGCEKEVQTVEWYKANDVERMDMVRECKANPDKLSRTPNCVNAKQANREIYNAGGSPPGQGSGTSAGQP